jgi:hypothetical protein
VTLAACVFGGAAGRRRCRRGDLGPEAVPAHGDCPPLPLVHLTPSLTSLPSSRPGSRNGRCKPAFHAAACKRCTPAITQQQLRHKWPHRCEPAIAQQQLRHKWPHRCKPASMPDRRSGGGQPASDWHAWLAGGRRASHSVVASRPATGTPAAVSGIHGVDAANAP